MRYNVFSPALLFFTPWFPATTFTLLINTWKNLLQIFQTNISWKIPSYKKITVFVTHLLPFIDMRGVPATRYQGKPDWLSEAALRWDFVRRRSLILFGEAGTVFDRWSEFGNSDWIATGGSGSGTSLQENFTWGWEQMWQGGLTPGFITSCLEATGLNKK